MFQELYSTVKNTAQELKQENQHLEHFEQQDVDIVEKPPPPPPSSENIGNSSITTTPFTKLKISKNARKRSLSPPVPMYHDVKRFNQISDNNQQDPNEFDVFCESLAIQLKKMPLRRALICQEQLQSVMTQERLFQLAEPDPIKCSMSLDYEQPMEEFNSEHYSTSPGSSSIH